MLLGRPCRVYRLPDLAFLDGTVYTVQWVSQSPKQLQPGVRCGSRGGQTHSGLVVRMEELTVFSLAHSSCFSLWAR